MTATIPVRKANIDTWSSGPMPVVRATRQRMMLILLGAPALIPIAFEVPGTVQGLVTGDGNVVHSTGNDVLGSGGALLLFAMLSITPLRTLTRRKWFVPLRRWYGVVFASSIFLDAALASNDTAFNGPVAAKLAIHSFLFMGLTMTLLLVPLLIQGIWNQWSMRRLGKYWKPFQRYGTYTVWGLLAAHLMLLEGFGVSHADQAGPDSPVYAVLHQRLYEFTSCSALMIVLRLPPVRHWIQGRQRDGQVWRAWMVLMPLVLLFLLAYVMFANELFYKGIAAFTLNPIND
jgi:DMSO/TMAO reductase YedYZ heme-binding membrane subunit